MNDAIRHDPTTTTFDVAVIGAGMGGLYAVHRFASDGLDVIGLEAAEGVGGVWLHNGYPGARVDLESDYYCYFFDPELYADWEWTERYAAQPEILRYLNHVADRYAVRERFRFNVRVESARWDEKGGVWTLSTDAGDTVTARHVVMTTGQLSKPRRPEFPGLDDFRGEWYQTSNWPRTPVDLSGKRVAVIGTGSSGVQAVTAIAPIASRLTVFQRTPNYSVPAANRPSDVDRHVRMSQKVGELWDELLTTGAGNFTPPAAGPRSEFTVEQQQQLLEQRWAFGGQPILTVFTDQGTDLESNTVVADFVRSKIRQKVDDENVARLVAPTAYPIGVRRVAVDTGYYESFNLPHVDLVSLLEEQIVGIEPDGIRTTTRFIPLDVIVFAIGFEAFTGAIAEIDIRNDAGATPFDSWANGPETWLGLMHPGFPNFYTPLGPGSPSVLANNNVMNVIHLDYIAEVMAHARGEGASIVAPTPAAAAAWTAEVNRVNDPLIRRQFDNYMVLTTLDGERRLIPYGGPLKNYLASCADEAAAGYPGLTFEASPQRAVHPPSTTSV